MRKLEEDYYYETDQDQLNNALRVLDTDLFHAVEFFVTENPVLFVSNLERKF